eukprot:g2801.t1
MSNAMILSSPDSSRSPSPERGPAVDPTTEAAKVRDKPIDRRTAGAATLRRDDERPAGGGGMQRLVLKVSNDDAAFILGKGGSTKRKIERVSSAQLSLNEKTLSLSIIGSHEAVGRAKDYVNMVLKQRVGPVHLNFDEARDDLTFVNVPVDSVGFVTGRNGSALRSAESEWGTLMFFAKHRLESKRMQDSRQRVEKLAIFGPEKARQGAMLKVMSSVEHKHPGHFVNSHAVLRCRLPNHRDSRFGTETMALARKDFAYVLGKSGSTRKKLARASGCIIEYVGRCAVFAGSEKARKRGMEYLKWLIAQRRGSASINFSTRDDLTLVKVPLSAIGFVTGKKGQSLRVIENQTGTFCFTNKSARTTLSNNVEAKAIDSDKHKDSIKPDVNINKDHEGAAATDISPLSRNVMGTDSDSKATKAARDSECEQTEDLLIFSHNESGRKRAREIVLEKIAESHRRDALRNHEKTQDIPLQEGTQKHAKIPSGDSHQAKLSVSVGSRNHTGSSLVLQSSRVDRKQDRQYADPKEELLKSTDNHVKVGVQTIKLASGVAAYLLGKGGATKKRLIRFSGAALEIDSKKNKVKISGTAEQREIARMCIDITLSQQRGRGKVNINFSRFDNRRDITMLDVKESHVGFILGQRGRTLREFEARYGTFMFFDNDTIHNGNRKRLYIMGASRNRKRALNESAVAVAVVVVVVAETSENIECTAENEDTNIDPEVVTMGEIIAVVRVVIVDVGATAIAAVDATEIAAVIPWGEKRNGINNAVVVKVAAAAAVPAAVVETVLAITFAAIVEGAVGKTDENVTKNRIEAAVRSAGEGVVEAVVKTQVANTVGVAVGATIRALTSREPKSP